MFTPILLDTLELSMTNLEFTTYQAAPAFSAVFPEIVQPTMRMLAVCAKRPPPTPLEAQSVISQLLNVSVAP